MKQKLYKMIGLWLTAVCLLSACDKTATDNDRLPVPDGEDMALQIRAHKAAFMEEDGTTRAVTDDVTLQTTFDEGDAIGVFAIKNGEVQPNCKNLKLTLQADGTWKGEEGQKVYLITDAQYFAYSPYKTDFDNATSFDYIYDNFTVATDQSTPELFAANDLMTCDNCRPNTTEKSLTFTFKHRLALVEIGPMHCKGKGNLYPLNSTKPMTVTDMNTFEQIIGYSFPTKPQQLPKMHLLMKPGTYSGGFMFAYKRQSATAIMQNTSSRTLAANTRHKLKPYKKRDVAVGDYYYSDGSVFPKEWITTGTPPPDINNGCVGVVYNTTMATDDAGREWKNGYVLALNIWKGTITEYTDQGGVFSTLTLDGLQWSTLASSSTGNKLYADGKGIIADINKSSGYNECLNIKKRSDASSFPAVYNAIDFNNDYPVPSETTSGWFLPSAQQIVLAMRILNGNNSIFEDGSTADWQTGYLESRPIFDNVRAPSLKFFHTRIYHGVDMTYYATSTEGSQTQCYFILLGISYYGSVWQLTKYDKNDKIKSDEYGMSGLGMRYILMF